MLQQGLHPDSADYDGRTALMLAAGHGHSQAVALLLAAGADPSLQDALQVSRAPHERMWPASTAFPFLQVVHG